MDLVQTPQDQTGCIRRSRSVCAKRCRPYPTNDSQPVHVLMPCCQPAKYQHSEFLASWAGQQQHQHPCGTPAASCLVQQRSALLHFPPLQAPPPVAAQACPSSMMGVAMTMCARSLGSTMQALQAASLLCEACPEAAATDSALCRAEQLMAETIKTVRLTLRLAVFLKQQQQPWVCFGGAAAVLPAAAAGAAANVAAANMAAAEQCDPSIADSACSGYAGLPRAPPQLMLSPKWVGSTQMQVHQQQQQQQQQQDAVQSAQQDAGLQEEVGSSWE